MAQDESRATYCSLVTKDDGRLDWTKAAIDLDAQIRACDPWPGAHTEWQGQRLTLRQSSVIAVGGGGSAEPGTVSIDKTNGILIQTGDGLVAVRELQLPDRNSFAGEWACPAGED